MEKKSIYNISIKKKKKKNKKRINNKTQNKN